VLPANLSNWSSHLQLRLRQNWRKLLIILIVVTLAALIHARSAAILRYLSALWAGDADPVWPHAILLSVSALAGISSTIGLLLESHKRKDHRLHEVAASIVICGVMIELICTICLFVIDERISLAQQAKIIELLPRELDDTSRDKMASCRPLVHAPVQVQSLYADSEGYRLASQVIHALYKGGMEVDDKRGQAELDLTKPQPFGVYVEGPASEVPFVLCLAKAIRETKELSGTVAKQIPDQYPLAVYVGLKPVD
jgi:hypothetical protein